MVTLPLAQSSVECGNAGQLFAFHPLKERTASRRDVGKVGRSTCLVQRRNRITASSNRNQLPALVSFAAACAAAFVAASKGSISNAPSGPFQINVFALAKTPSI